MKGYRNLSVPNQLYQELENFVTESKGRYVSVAEVVREAVRDFLQSNHQHPKGELISEQEPLPAGQTCSRLESYFGQTVL